MQGNDQDKRPTTAQRVKNTNKKEVKIYRKSTLILENFRESMQPKGIPVDKKRIKKDKLL